MSRLPSIVTRAIRRDPAKLERDRRRVERGLWPKVRRNIGRNIGRIGILEDAVAAYYCATDPATPFKAKAGLMGALAYFVLPNALMPRILRLTRLVDSGAMLASALREFGQHITPEHRLRAKTAMARLREEEEEEEEEEERPERQTPDR